MDDEGGSRATGLPPWINERNDVKYLEDLGSSGCSFEDRENPSAFLPRNVNKGRTENMRLKKRRFDHLSRGEAIDLLNRLEGAAAGNHPQRRQRQCGSERCSTRGDGLPRAQPSPPDDLPYCGGRPSLATLQVGAWGWTGADRRIRARTPRESMVIVLAGPKKARLVNETSFGLSSPSTRPNLWRCLRSGSSWALSRGARS